MARIWITLLKLHFTGRQEAMQNFETLTPMDMSLELPRLMNQNNGYKTTNITIKETNQIHKIYRL
jgi:hypothetical protein